MGLPGGGREGHLREAPDLRTAARQIVSPGPCHVSTLQVESFSEPEIMRGPLASKRGRSIARACRTAASTWPMCLVGGTCRSHRRKSSSRPGPQGARRCAIVVDYLELWAKTSRELRDLSDAHPGSLSPVAVGV